MKTHQLILILVISLMVPTLTISQVKKQDWREMKPQIEKLKKSNSAKKLVAKKFNLQIERGEASYLQPLAGKTKENFKTISKGENNMILEFEEERNNVMMSLLKFSWMRPKSAQPSIVPSFSIVGFTSNNQEVTPIIAITQKDEIEHNNGVIKFNKALTNEVNISFAQPVSRVKLTTNADEASTVVFELSPIYWQDQPVISNPPIKISNCEDVNINVILDSSASMTDKEKDNIRKGLLDFMEEEIIGESLKANISFVEFGKKSEIGTSLIPVNREAISPDGAIHDYLFNIYGNFNSTSKQNWTNWEGAFEVAEDMNKSNPANLLLFISDGLPNGSYQSKLSAPESLKKTIHFANLIKKQGTHIYAIGKDDLNHTVAPFWLGQITNGKKSILSDKNQNSTNADYSVVNSFLEVSNILKDALVECDPSFEIDLKAKLLNDKTSELVWESQEGLVAENYSVYRSKNKKDWIELSGIAELKASNHIFIDQTPYDGRNYYQIRATRNNNTPISSPIRILKIDIDKLVKVFPNPTRGDVTVTLNEDLLKDRDNYSVELQDVLGKVINLEIDITDTGYFLKTKPLQGGTYLLVLKEKDDVMHSERLVILK